MAPYSLPVQLSATTSPTGNDAFSPSYYMFFEPSSVILLGDSQEHVLASYSNGPYLPEGPPAHGAMSIEDVAAFLNEDDDQPLFSLQYPNLLPHDDGQYSNTIPDQSYPPSAPVDPASYEYCPTAYGARSWWDSTRAGQPVQGPSLDNVLEPSVVHSASPPANTHSLQKIYPCPCCSLRYMHKRTLKRHIKNKHASIADQAQKELKLTCHDCGVRYSRQDALDRHIRTQVCERRKKGMAQVH